MRHEQCRVKDDVANGNFKIRLLRRRELDLLPASDIESAAEVPPHDRLQCELDAHPRRQSRASPTRRHDDATPLADPSFQRIDPEGIVAHQILCGVGRGDRYMLIIEDIDLAAYPAGPPPARLYAIPLFPEETDSSPCTVFAELNR